MWRIIGLLLLLVPNQSDCADCIVLKESKVGGVTRAGLLFTAGELTQKAARGCLQGYSSGISVKPSMLSAKLYSQPSDANLSDGVVDECRSPGECRYMLRTARKPRGALADLLQSSVGTVMRYRPPSGSIRRTVLEGMDASRLQFGGSRFEILHLIVSEPSPLFRDRQYEGRRVEMYLLAKGKLIESDCKGLTERLSKELDAPWIWAHFRTDPFFVQGLLYPYPLLFAEPWPLPNEKEYARSMEITCEVMYGKSDCVTQIGTQIQ